MRVLVLGSGAREHALATALAASPQRPEVWVAPGNDGMQDVARRFPVGLDDLGALARAAREHDIALTIAGSEDPLVRGVWDVFDAAGLRLFGPSQPAAALEGSKVFAKEFMCRHRIPTAEHAVATDLESARRALAGFDLPVVIKADGLAAGKGVHIARSASEAEASARTMLVDGAYGDAGRRIVIERALTGPELSVFALCDGYNFRILGAARDHKRARDGDEGPNTGGMGAYSPVPDADASVVRMVADTVIAPVLAGMVDEGSPYRGFLYAGLMMTPDGPRVLEFNCRLGDPEAQVLVPRWRGDLLALLAAADRGDVHDAELEVDPAAAVGVVLASEGYPEAPRVGRRIDGIDTARATGAAVFVAGARREGDALRTTGGRILTVVGRGDDLRTARQRAYDALDAIRVEGGFYRRDIAGVAASPSGRARA